MSINVEEENKKKEIKNRKGKERTKRREEKRKEIRGKIIAFLKENKGKAFTEGEIHRSVSGFWGSLFEGNEDGSIFETELSSYESYGCNAMRKNDKAYYYYDKL